MRGQLENVGVNPGPFRPIKVRDFTVTFDHGSEVRTPLMLPDDFCQVESLTGRELETAQMVSDEVQFLMIFRYRPQYKARMQLLKGTRVFEVLAVLHDETRHTRSHLFCKEVNPA